MHPMLIAAPFTRVKSCKQHKCPATGERIKMRYTYAMERFPTTEKNEILPFAANGWNRAVILSEASQRQISSITYMWNLKYDTNELMYKTETHSQTLKTNLWLPKGKGEEDKLGVWD